MNLVLHKVAPAMAVGCPVVLKPAPQAPLSSLALAKLIEEWAGRRRVQHTDVRCARCRETGEG
ncbi:MAG: aldehyde dehydrogenase family protein [Flavobacteriales bacterium]|nr:aldehyde dehydrogenase family protein [Flavobacteriales bacterium]